MRAAAPLHDIGKVGIPNEILLKPGPLTDEERAAMMQHVAIGPKMLAAACSPILRLAAEIAGTHHERWDGTGYLRGLAGEEIPMSGRVTAAADVFDALTHARPYKEAWDHGQALAEIACQAWRQLDPRVVDALLGLDFDELDAITS
jgi:putative two-component system response regulator